MYSYLKICAGIAILALYSCETTENQNKIETYPVTKPIFIDTSSHIEYVTEIVAVKNIEIRSMIGGYLSKVHVDEGAKVAEGQLLFSINNVSYKEAVTKTSALLKVAKAEADNAQLELDNIQNLVAKNVISKTELEFAKNKLQIARARVEEALADQTHAKQMLSYTEIRAPFSGVINRLPQKIGSLIEEGTLLTSLSQNNEVFAYFDISEKEYLSMISKFKTNIQQDRKVELILANSEIYPLFGEIETMESQFDERTGNISIRARFDNTNNVLKHGSSGKIKIKQDYKNALVIPQKSTFEVQDRLFVYVLDKNNKVKTRQIHVQTRMPHLYIISGGLKTSDRIIYEGIQTVEDGMIIQPKMLEMKTILNRFSKS